MTLQSKILHLKLEAALAVKHANAWQRLIDLYGEEKATAFYTHLGLNHLPRKSFEYDGLQLRREPRPTELIVVKGVSQAQESSREHINALLLRMRSSMISDALRQLDDLNPADYHTLIVSIPAPARTRLRDSLLTVFNVGRTLVQQELSRTKQSNGDDADDFDELDLLTNTTTARVANDVQARVIGAASRQTLLGVVGDPLITAVQSEMDTGSVTYVDRAASSSSNRALNLGRADEMRERADDIDHYEQSALLDQNVCGPCAEDDGQEADNPDALPGGPNPDCLGSDLCRCFVVAVVQ